MTADAALARARAAFAGRSWGAAAGAYADADATAPLGLDDLEAAGLAAHLSGADDAAIELLARAHQAALAAADLPRAAHLAFWLGMMLVQRGEGTVGGGWLARAGRLVAEGGLDTVERGYLLVPDGLRALDEGEPGTALERFEEAAAIADRFADPDLATMARLGRGRTLLVLGEVERGVAMLDEAMLGVTSGEVGPIVVGIVYCAAIEGFQSVFDLGRAQAWTDELTRWCATQPELVPFRGRCLVYRAELMRMHGSWAEASDEARRAEAWLSRPPPEPAVGEALYQQAELLRLRGEYGRADEVYRAAADWGRRPEPGLALLRLAQGRPDEALAMLRRAASELHGDVARAPLLDPLVEVALAAGDPDLAREAADDLERTAALTRAPFLGALADRCRGALLLAAGEAEPALVALRRAAAGWQELDAPYERARARVEIGRALRRLDDSASAEIELEAAREAFRRLGAAPDVARTDGLLREPGRRPGGLSDREAEVLRLVAAGRTNREVAESLVISKRTVDRHVSNIYAKIGVSSRSAATAWAYEHGLA